MYTLLRISVYRSPSGHERERLDGSPCRNPSVVTFFSLDLLCSMTEESTFDIAPVLLTDSTQ